jgi:Tetratricopeptide repeat
MELCKRILGAKHPDTVTSMTNLAATYRQQGRLDEAETLYSNIEQIKNSKSGFEIGGCFKRGDILGKKSNLVM